MKGESSFIRIARSYLLLTLNVTPNRLNMRRIIRLVKHLKCQIEHENRAMVNGRTLWCWVMLWGSPPDDVPPDWGSPWKHVVSRPNDALKTWHIIPLLLLNSQAFVSGRTGTLVTHVFKTVARRRMWVLVTINWPFNVCQLTLKGCPTRSTNGGISTFQCLFCWCRNDKNWWILEDILLPH